MRKSYLPFFEEKKNFLLQGFKKKRLAASTRATDGRAHRDEGPHPAACGLPAGQAAEALGPPRPPVQTLPPSPTGGSGEPLCSPLCSRCLGLQAVKRVGTTPTPRLSASGPATNPGRARRRGAAQSGHSEAGGSIVPEECRGQRGTLEQERELWGHLANGVLVGADIRWFTSKAYKLVGVCRVDFSILNVIVYLTTSLRGC